MSTPNSTVLWSTFELLPCIADLSISTIDYPDQYITNGIPEPLYHIPFAVPVLPSRLDESGYSYIIYAEVNYSSLDSFFNAFAFSIILWSVVLALSSLTLINVFCLTVPSSRGKAMHWAILVGCAAEVALAGTAVWLQAYGGQNSIYLGLTADYDNNVWSTAWTAAASTHLISAVLVLVAVEVSLWVHGRAVMEWVSLKWNTAVYTTFLVLLTLLGLSAVLIEIMVSIYMLQALDIVTDVTMRATRYDTNATWFLWLVRVDDYVTRVSLGSWCSMFLVTAAIDLKRSHTSQNTLPTVVRGIHSVGQQGMVLPLVLTVVTGFGSANQCKVLTIPVIFITQSLISIFVDHDIVTATNQGLIQPPTNAPGLDPGPGTICGKRRDRTQGRCEWDDMPDLMLVGRHSPSVELDGVAVR